MFLQTKMKAPKTKRKNNKKTKEYEIEKKNSIKTKSKNSAPVLYTTSALTSEKFEIIICL